MESQIATSLNLKYHPVAILWTDEKPKNALQFKKGKWGCVMWLFANAAKGQICVFDRETYGCWGGGVGLGFGNQYINFPGGIECFYRFLSDGNKKWKTGQRVAQEIKNFVRKDFLEDFLNGERYKKSFELVKKFVEQLPIIDIPQKYVVFKPLRDVDLNKEEPKVIVFLVNPDQLSALITLANYNREGNENVIIPWAAGCQTIGVLAYKEAKSKTPRAIVGLTDISARRNIRRQLDKDSLSFAIPLKMFQEMEENLKHSFLQRPTWKALKV